jgi:hypothetical protein
LCGVGEYSLRRGIVLRLLRVISASTVFCKGARSVIIVETLYIKQAYSIYVDYYLSIST